MVVYSGLNSLLLKILYGGILLEEGHIPEISLFNLTDWGWVVFFIIVILVLWGLIIFQSNSKGAHQSGGDLNPENFHKSDDH